MRRRPPFSLRPTFNPKYRWEIPNYLSPPWQITTTRPLYGIDIGTSITTLGLSTSKNSMPTMRNWRQSLAISRSWRENLATCRPFPSRSASAACSPPLPRPSPTLSMLEGRLLPCGVGWYRGPAVCALLYVYHPFGINATRDEYLGGAFADSSAAQLSVAELVSAYPTSGGLYFTVSRLAPGTWVPSISWWALQSAIILDHTLRLDLNIGLLDGSIS